jgi:hypothetical protein
VDPRTLVVLLESPLVAYDPSGAPVREVVLAGLRWPGGEYWPALALGWLEQGAQVNGEIHDALCALAERGERSQRLRHRAFALAKRWSRANFPKTYPPGQGAEEIRTLVGRLLPDLVAGDDAVSAALREQLGRARIGDIHLTGVGFFADIEVPEDAPRAEGADFVGGSADIELVGVPHGAGCVLFVRDGRSSLLEGFAYDGTWAEDTVVASVKNVVPIRPPGSHGS